MVAINNSGMYGVYKEQAGCLACVIIEQADLVHLQISASPSPDMDFTALCQALAAYTNSKNAAIISLEVFGVDSASKPCLDTAFGCVTWPVTWVEGIGDMPAPLWGIQAWAIAGPTITPVSIANQVIGSTFETKTLRFCRLGGVLAENVSESRTSQTQSVFKQLSAGLAAVDMDFADVLRTWFYNRDMLEWYDAFNEVRTSFFEANHVFQMRVPASTGIGARCGGNAALTAGLIAFAAKDVGDAAPRAAVIPSPMQCPALDYGSSFSRAMELRDGALRWLWVSGTASIAREGESAHLGDIDKQIALSMEVIRAILDLRRMDWRHVTRTIAYFKHREHAPQLHRWFEKEGVEPFPTVFANTDICRDDLLFELELDAVSTT
jgi:enamine deaminase RidA (YjgF/YER057c/UK114 family)